MDSWNGLEYNFSLKTIQFQPRENCIICCGLVPPWPVSTEGSLNSPCYWWGIFHFPGCSAASISEEDAAVAQPACLQTQGVFGRPGWLCPALGRSCSLQLKSGKAEKQPGMCLVLPAAQGTHAGQLGPAQQSLGCSSCPLFPSSGASLLPLLLLPAALPCSLPHQCSLEAPRCCFP